MTATETEMKIEQPTQELLTAAYALTHRMHGLQRSKTQYPKDSTERKDIEEALVDLRAQRDIIDREIIRRTEA